MKVIDRLEEVVVFEYPLHRQIRAYCGERRLENKILKSSEERPRKASKGYVMLNRTKTDTGRRVEYTEALGRILVKELCKMAP